MGLVAALIMLAAIQAFPGWAAITTAALLNLVAAAFSRGG